MKIRVFACTRKLSSVLRVPPRCSDSTFESVPADTHTTQAYDETKAGFDPMVVPQSLDQKAEPAIRKNRGCALMRERTSIQALPRPYGRGITPEGLKGR